MRKTLSTRSLQSLRPDPARKAIFDTKVKGLHVVPSTTMPGQGAFWMKYVANNGKQRKARVGSFPAMSLADARAQAHAFHSAVASGEDPTDNKSTRDTHGATTAIDTYLTTYSAANHRERTREEVRRLLGDAKDAWAGRRLDEVAPGDVVALLDACAKRRSPTQSNRLYSYLSGFFNWAADRNMIENVPIRRGMKAIKREATRDRWLRDDELRAVWNAAEDFGYPFGPLVQVLVLTGQRLRQVAGMRWEEFEGLDSETPIWRVPSDRMKGKREQEVPLARCAAGLLLGIKELGLSMEFVFSTQDMDGDTVPMNWFSKPKARLDRLSGVSDWRLHDLRRTVATNLEQMGVERITISSILAHHIPGVTEIYTRSDRLNRKRVALESWSRRVSDIVNHDATQPSNIVELSQLR